MICELERGVNSLLNNLYIAWNLILTKLVLMGKLSIDDFLQNVSYYADSVRGKNNLPLCDLFLNIQIILQRFSEQITTYLLYANRNFMQKDIILKKLRDFYMAPFKLRLISEGRSFIFVEIVSSFRLKLFHLFRLLSTRQKSESCDRLQSFWGKY